MPSLPRDLYRFGSIMETAVPRLKAIEAGDDGYPTPDEFKGTLAALGPLPTMRVILNQDHFFMSFNIHGGSYNKVKKNTCFVHWILVVC